MKRKTLKERLTRKISREEAFKVCLVLFIATILFVGIVQTIIDIALPARF